MANQSRIELILTAVDKGLTTGINRAIGSVKSLGNQARQSVAGITSLTGGIAGLVATVGGMVSVAAGMQKLVTVSREFDKISAGLITATGSAENADQAFGAIQDFATRTPYDLAQVTDSFVKLVNFGLDPSERALTSYGNTSSALGRELNQMIEAVADAATGEFERLKEFGIKASSEGDKVTFTFRGMATTVGKNAKEIEDYLIKLGETNFGDAMVNRMVTLDGALSNLGDEWDKVFLNISKAGIGEMIADGVRVGIGALEDLNAMISSGELEVQLRAQIGRWSAWGADISTTVDSVLQRLGDMEIGGKDGVTALTYAFREFPENVRAFIGIMTVQVAAGFDKVKALARVFKAQIKAAFSDPTDRTSFGDRLKAENAIIDQAKAASIDAILTERDAALESYSVQQAAAQKLKAEYEAQQAAAKADTSDKLAQYRVVTEGSEKSAAAVKKEGVERKKAAAEAKKLYEEQKKIAAEKLRAASQDRILALELEKIGASKLPTELARAEAELAIDRQIMAERVSLKRQELAAIKADREASQADIIRAESELAELLVNNEIQLNDRMRDLAETRMDDVELSWRRGIASAQEYQAAIREAVAAGAIDLDQGKERLIASGDDMGAALSLGFQKARERMQTDAELMVAIGDQLADQLANGLGSAFDSMIMGTKSAKDAFIDMARSTISWLAQMILKQLLYNAIAGAMKAFGGGMADGGSVAPAVALAGGGSVPGWSPHPKADNIWARLTAREFVQPVDAVDYYGEPFMESVRRKLFPRNLALALSGATLPRAPRGSRLAEGGMAAGQPGGTTIKAGDTRIAVVNVEDESSMKRFLNSSGFDTILINRLRRNTATIKTILG